MIRTISIALALWSSLASAAETWSCGYQFDGKGKVWPQEWVVSSDRMSAPKGYGYWVVVVNNADTVAAFHRLWKDEDTKAGVSGHFPNTGNDYVMIDKRTGFSVDVIDVLGVDHGVTPNVWMPPTFSIGHCSRADLKTPQRPVQ